MKSVRKSKGENLSILPRSGEIIDGLNRVRKKVSRGKVFSDSTDIIRDMREERDKELDVAIRGRKE